MDPQRSNQVSDDLTNTYDERRFKIYDFLKLKLESEKEEGKFFSEWNELHLRLRAIQNGDCNYHVYPVKPAFGPKFYVPYEELSDLAKEL